MLKHISFTLTILLLLLLTSCSIPQVKAQDRTFINLSIQYLDQYKLPKTDFQNTKVGGLSAISYDPEKSLYYAISDDRSQLSPARFYTLNITLQPQFKVEIKKVTPLKNQENKTYPPNTIDPEGIAIVTNNTIYISSEGVTKQNINPFICQFQLTTGTQTQCLNLPSRYLIKTETRTQTQGVRDNLGFESLTIFHGGYGKAGNDPSYLFSATESSLIQDYDEAQFKNGLKNRFLQYIIGGGTPLPLAEYYYQLDPPKKGTIDNGLVELLVLPQPGRFLSLERTFGLNQKFGIKLFQITTFGSTDTSQVQTLKGNTSNLRPIKKKLLLDLSTLNIPLDNIEGMTLGPKFPDGTQSLILVSDDNFRKEQTTQFLLFKLKTAKI